MVGFQQGSHLAHIGAKLKMQMLTLCLLNSRHSVNMKYKKYTNQLFIPLSM